MCVWRVIRTKVILGALDMRLYDSGWVIIILFVGALRWRIIGFDVIVVWWVGGYALSIWGVATFVLGTIRWSAQPLGLVAEIEGFGIDKLSGLALPFIRDIWVSTIFKEKNVHFLVVDLPKCDLNMSSKAINTYLTDLIDFSDTSSVLWAGRRQCFTSPG